MNKLGMPILYKWMREVDWLPARRMRLLAERGGESLNGIVAFKKKLSKKLLEAVPIDISSIQDVLGATDRYPRANVFPPLQTFWFEGHSPIRSPSTNVSPMGMYGLLIECSTVKKGNDIHGYKCPADGYLFEGAYFQKHTEWHAVLPTYKWEFMVDRKGCPMCYSWNNKLNQMELLMNTAIWSVAQAIGVDPNSIDAPAAYDVSRLILLLEFLNAKNVTLVDAVHSTRKMRKERRSRRELKYKTIIITKPGVNKKTGDQSTQNHRYTALHVVRGHLKTYDGKGLFGKYTGTYFFPSHTRGELKHGQVNKTYKPIRSI